MAQQDTSKIKLNLAQLLPDIIWLNAAEVNHICAGTHFQQI